MPSRSSTRNAGLIRLTCNDDLDVSEGLDRLKEQVAAEAFGDPRLGARLRGGNRQQLEEDAAQLARAAGIRQGISVGGSPTPEAALLAFRRRQARGRTRLFGR